MIDKNDKRTLLAVPAFRRFMLTVIEMSGVFEAAPDPERMAFREGRRSLALEILRDLDEAQAVPNLSGIPCQTSIQLLSEAVQSAASKEKPVGRSDTYSELGNEGDAA